MVCYDLWAFHPIRLQDSLIFNISGSNQLISWIFCMEIIVKGRWHLRLPRLVACGHLSLIPPISLQDSLIINFSGKNKFMSCFFHGVGHQEKALPLLVGCSQLCLSSNQIIRFFDQQYLLITTWYLWFLHLDNDQGKEASKTVGCVQACLWFNQIPGFFDHQYL